MLSLKTNLLCCFLLLSLAANAQIDTYKFKREITGVQTTWHNVLLPNSLYKELKTGFEDLRIFAISGKDTLEVPYLLKQRSDQVNSKEITFKQLNQSSSLNGYYYTFQTTAASVINQINLNFKQDNFDWKIALEGSNNNQEWFAILNDYRILAIKNKDTDYHFSTINFPDSKYQYFRLAIKSATQPDLLSAKILKTDTLKGTYQNVKYQAFQLKNDANRKETRVDITLATPTPLSYLKLNAQSGFDFYRPIKIECATDSFKTEQGMQYNYASVYEGTISSFEQPVFSFPNTITSKLRITIQNSDNKPLILSGLELKGNIYTLTARFDDPKLNYALYYGNPKAVAPSYEIEKFENKIPANLTAVSIGEAEHNAFYAVKTEKPLFENKAWLWVLMAVIIVLLGWFSFKMLRN